MGPRYVDRKIIIGNNVIKKNRVVAGSTSYADGEI
jgi:hypothetical protein